MEKYIFICIKENQWLVSPLMKDIKEVIEKHKSAVDFVEYHPYKNNSEFAEENYIDYLE